jgi:Domain of unknown function (DUF1883)
VNFVHVEFLGGPEDLAVVTLDAQANVMLLDDAAFAAYRTGGPYDYHGGWSTWAPVQLAPPRDGTWHVVVDLGGGGGTVQAAVRIVQGATRRTA